MKNLLIILICLGLAGCATYWSSLPWSIDSNRNKLMELEIGMTKEEVIGVMGNPYKREAYALPNGGILEFLIYLTRYTDSGSIPDSDTTPICLEYDKVTGWGRNFYVQRKQRYEVEIDESLNADITVDVKTKDEGEKDSDLYSELIKLEDLRERGILTDEEFQAQKSKLLSR